MALEDIDSLSEKELNAAGHVEDHKKIVRGLKSTKEELTGRLSETALDTTYAPIGSTGTPVQFDVDPDGVPVLVIGDEA